MSNLARVDKFLADAKTFYMATVDGDKPKCRPIGFHMLVDDKIYFGLGTFKEVYKQLEANPYMEIVACIDDKFLRYYGKVKFEQDPKYAEMALEALPMLKQLYNEKTGYVLGMVYLEDATAEFRNMMAVEEKIEF